MHRTPVAAAPADVTLIDDLLIEWDATPASRKTARYTLIDFAASLNATARHLGDATQADCLAWLEQRRQTVAASTVVKNWGQLRAFYAIAQDDVADPLGGRRSPMARIPQPHAPLYARTKAATVDEYDRLLEAFDKRTTLGLRDATIVSLMFRSGVRVGELAQIDLADLDLEERRILVEETKNGEPRRPPLHPETLTLLRRYLRRRGERPGPLFVNEGPRAKSSRLKTASIQTMFKRAAARAGVDLTPHTLRRGWYVEYITHGGDQVTGMHIAGWKREIMPYRYMADRRDEASHAVFDEVATRQTQARRKGRRALRAV